MASIFLTITVSHKPLRTLHHSLMSNFSVQCEQLRPVLRAIEKREALLADKEEYDSLIADPNRLIKGSSAA